MNQNELGYLLLGAGAATAVFGPSAMIHVHGRIKENMGKNRLKKYHQRTENTKYNAYTIMVVENYHRNWEPLILAQAYKNLYYDPTDLEDNLYRIEENTKEPIEGQTTVYHNIYHDVNALQAYMTENERSRVPIVDVKDLQKIKNRIIEENEIKMQNLSKTKEKIKEEYGLMPKIITKVKCNELKK